MKIDYIDIEYGNPKLFLVLKINKWNREKNGTNSFELSKYYRFKDPKKWKPYLHQTCGLGCGQVAFWGMELKPKGIWLEALMKVIEEKYFESSSGLFNNSLESLNEYEQMLNKHGLSANVSYVDFQEGVYPIDISLIHEVTKTKLPKDLENLLIFNKEVYKIFGCMNRWDLWIVTENSD